MKKEYTYTLIVKDPKNGIINKNVVNRRKGYGQSCYATEAAARKGLNGAIKFATDFCGQTVIAWELWKGCQVIDKYNA